MFVALVRRSPILNVIDPPPAGPPALFVVGLHSNTTTWKPEDLLLDTMDPRSRLGHPLDFREFLPRIAWFGSSLDPSEFIPLEARISHRCVRSLSLARNMSRLVRNGLIRAPAR